MKQLLTAIPLLSSGIEKFLMTLKLSVVCLFIGITQVNGNLYSQGNISLDIEGKAVKEVLKAIEDLSSYRFFYNAELPLLREKINIQTQNKSISEVMDQIISGTGYSYKVFENNLVVISSGEANQPEP
jgi:TonB-dependent starch-binding outer membrane protein SusC